MTWVITFIALKLGEVIDWAWWLVLWPLWLGPAVLLALGLAALGLYALHNLYKRMRSAWRRR